jgi:hypothetical protein
MIEVTVQNSTDDRRDPRFPKVFAAGRSYRPQADPEGLDKERPCLGLMESAAIGG